ncbi:hypothetical protein ACFWIB_40130 [Streptomyces sp. NPDC127051]|uniref:hypothetical protein n=1 Tax=Streptomyces sp. NPDC127051 TaxID=3347119 RepID=UPI00364FD929
MRRLIKGHLTQAIVLILSFSLLFAGKAFPACVVEISNDTDTASEIFHKALSDSGFSDEMTIPQADAAVKDAVSNGASARGSSAQTPDFKTAALAIRSHASVAVISRMYRDSDVSAGRVPLISNDTQARQIREEAEKRVKALQDDKDLIAALPKKENGGDRPQTVDQIEKTHTTVADAIEKKYPVSGGEGNFAPAAKAAGVVNTGAYLANVASVWTDKNADNFDKADAALAIAPFGIGQGIGIIHGVAKGDVKEIAINAIVLSVMVISQAWPLVGQIADVAFAVYAVGSFIYDLFTDPAKIKAQFENAVASVFGDNSGRGRCRSDRFAFPCSPPSR